MTEVSDGLGPEPNTFTVDFPVLPCHVSAGTLKIDQETGPQEVWGVLELNTILFQVKATLDRQQVGDLWRVLRKIENDMPKDKKLYTPGIMVPR